MDFESAAGDMKKRLGERIRHLRLARGLRQADFDEGDPTGIALSVYQSIEKGRANPSLTTLFKIAWKLDMELKDLFLFD